MFDSFYKRLRSLLQINVLPNCVGADLSTSAIKLVQLQPNSFIITQYVMQDITVLGANHLDNITKMAELLKQYWNIKSFQDKFIAMTLPYSSVIARTLQAPLFKNTTEFDSYIKNQISSTFEVDINLVDFDYNIIKTSAANKNQTVLIVIVKKEKIEELQALTELAHLPIGAIYVECYALYNLLCSLLAYNNISISKQSCLFMDIGISKVKILFVHDGELIYVNEVSTKYNEYLLKLLSADGNFVDTNLMGIYSSLQKYIDTNNSNIDKFNELVDIIVNDILKHIQLAKSQILIEHKINIQRLANICVAGGGVSIPGLITKLNLIFKLRVVEVSELLKLHNPHITKHELSRLITAIALARNKYND